MAARRKALRPQPHPASPRRDDLCSRHTQVDGGDEALLPRPPKWVTPWTRALAIVVHGQGRAVNSGLAIVGLTLLLVAVVSRRLSSTPVTPAMVVTAVGVLVGPLVLDDLPVRPTSSTVRSLAEATLAVMQQRAAMMELALGNLKEAAAHIARALDARPNDRAIRDTEGRIVLAGVAGETTVARKLAKLKEAESIFSDNIAKAPSEPYGLVSRTTRASHRSRYSPLGQEWTCRVRRRGNAHLLSNARPNCNSRPPCGLGVELHRQIQRTRPGGEESQRRGGVAASSAQPTPGERNNGDATRREGSLPLPRASDT